MCTQDKNYVIFHYTVLCKQEQISKGIINLANYSRFIPSKDCTATSTTFPFILSSAKVLFIPPNAFKTVVTFGVGLWL